MPRPIPVLGSSPQIDYTLPNIIKPPLYERDEYQTYSLISFKEIPLIYGGDSTKTTEEDRKEADKLLPYLSIGGDQLFEGGELVRREITQLNGFRAVSASGGYLLQYYSPDGYAWCDTYFDKLHALFDNTIWRFKILPQPDSIKLTEYYENWKETILATSDTIAYTQIVRGPGMREVWLGTYYYRPEPNGTTREYPLNGLILRHLESVTTSYEVVRGKQLWQGSLDPAFQNLPGGQVKVELIKFDYETDRSSTVSITFWYKDGLDKKNDHQCFSRGYRILQFGPGINSFSIPINLDVFPCSMVVNTIEGLPENELSVIDALNAISRRLLFNNFDVEIPNVLAIDWQRLGYIESIPVANQIVCYHANNNYWNNGLQPDDIAITVSQYPYVDLIAVDDKYYAKSADDFYGDDMPDSVRVQEIHAALEAQKFANNSKTNNARVANIGYYVERIARVLGISVDENGSIKSIRQAKKAHAGETIPPGWDFGQFGTNITGR
jgi:hypothetical protein